MSAIVLEPRSQWRMPQSWKVSPTKGRSWTTITAIQVTTVLIYPIHLHVYMRPSAGRPPNGLGTPPTGLGTSPYLTNPNSMLFGAFWSITLASARSLQHVQALPSRLHTYIHYFWFYIPTCNFMRASTMKQPLANNPPSFTNEPHEHHFHRRGAKYNPRSINH